MPEPPIPEPPTSGRPIAGARSTEGGGAGARLRYGDPWQDDPSARDPVRRARGHLVLPVTVWLTGEVGAGPLTGLTVSSLFLAQGEPPLVAGLVSAESDLAEALSTPGQGFTVHVLDARHKRLAQHFSGQLPAPAEQLAVQPSEHGPLLEAVAERLACRTLASRPFGWSVLVEASVERVQGARAGHGLAWYHGAFHDVG